MIAKKMEMKLGWRERERWRSELGGGVRSKYDQNTLDTILQELLNYYEKRNQSQPKVGVPFFTSSSSVNGVVPSQSCQQIAI